MTGGIYNELQDFRGYRKVMLAALKYTDRIGLSYTCDMSAFKESKWWEMFAGSFIRHEYDERGNLTVYFKVDHVTVEWLRSKRSIFDFWDRGDDDDLLWDLCLYREDREILSSITHEMMLEISEELREFVKTGSIT
ncbi:MAG: hypothetical protein K2J80_03255 [Oscillospiraceae bacterium]|nr:hypothetical protein [Oscillospiraceae bacterium]